MPALLLRLLIALVPEKKEFVGFLLVILLLPFFLIIIVVTIPTTIYKTVPLITPEQALIYQKASNHVYEQTGELVDWKKLVAVDAVLLEQDFSKADKNKAIALTWRFIEVIKKRDKDGNVIIIYREKSLNTVINELLTNGEINEEQAEDIRRYYEADLDELLSDGTGKPPVGQIPVPVGYDFVWPAPDLTGISSMYGERTDPFTGLKDFHTGVDLNLAGNADHGKLVIAAADGRVTSVVRSSTAACGFNIRIQHDDGVQTRYCHLSDTLVKEGQVVQQGTVIGKVGNTGRSSGSHLHLEMKIDGALVDPLPYIIGTKP